MRPFHRAGLERVFAFPVGEAYLFKHYFEEDSVFAELDRYYDRYEYRFEVPTSRFDEVADFLDGRGYALVEVRNPEKFAVVKRKFTDHPRELFKDSVYHRSLGRFNCFVMRDRESVERAVELSARRLVDTDLLLER